MLIAFPAMILFDPFTVLLFALREMFFCADSVVFCPQMMVLNSPFAILLFPQSIVELFHFPSCVSPPKIVAFSPSIVFLLPTIIVESFQVSLMLLFFPQMRSAFSQLLLLLFSFSVLVVDSVLVVENFPSRWMTPC